jgi:hypothetical protein
METTPFDLTQEQKGLLATLAQETGRPIPALLAEALESLQEHVHPRPGTQAIPGKDPTTPPADHEPPPRRKHLWKSLPTFCKTFPKKTSPVCPWMGPNSMTTIFTARPNTGMKRFCRYVLLIALFSLRDRCWAYHGLR